MGSIIAVANQKGGVGKTTIAVHLAVYLAQKDKRVVLVDGDPQANTTSWATDGQINLSGMFDLLIARQPLDAVIVPTKWDGVELLPSNSETGDAMTVLVTLRKPFDTIARALRPLTRRADYILLDMPPSKAACFHEMLYAADWVLVPTQLERLSLEGVTFMYRTVQELQEVFDNAPDLLAVVPNMTRIITNEHQEQMDALVEAFGAAVWPPIPESIRVAEACSFGTTLFEHAPNEKVTQAMKLVGERLIQALEG